MSYRSSLDFARHASRSNTSDSTSGYMMKKGKFKKWIRRYFVLKGSVLSNHANEKAEATWTVSLYGAQVGVLEAKNRISVKTTRDEIVLMVNDKGEFDRWVHALRGATMAPKDDLVKDDTPLNDEDDEAMYTGRRSLSYAR